MNQITEAELCTLLEQYPINNVRPNSRLCDLQTIGFIVTPQRPSEDGATTDPSVGPVISLAPEIEEMTYGGVMYHLKNGASVVLDRAAFTGFSKSFSADNRYSDYELAVTAENATSVSIRLVKTTINP